MHLTTCCKTTTIHDSRYESTLFWNPQAKGPHHQRSESLNSVKTDLADDGEEDDDEDEEGISIYPPENGSLYDWIWYLVTIPMVFLFVCTIADVRKPGAPKFHAYFAFVSCLAWMGLLSFYMVKGACCYLIPLHSQPTLYHLTPPYSYPPFLNHHHWMFLSCPLPLPLLLLMSQYLVHHTS